jgi:hypothetical protein
VAREVGYHILDVEANGRGVPAARDRDQVVDIRQRVAVEPGEVLDPRLTIKRTLPIPDGRILSYVTANVE